MTSVTKLTQDEFLRRYTEHTDAHANLANQMRNSNNLVDIMLPARHVCIEDLCKWAYEDEDDMSTQKLNPNWNAKTKSCDKQGQEIEHETPALYEIEDGSIWEPKGNYLRPDEIVINETEILLRVTYPLIRPAQVKLKRSTGFTRRQLVESIYKCYKKVYAQEDASKTTIISSDKVYNRGETNGKYGIWGHCMDNLFIEGIEYQPDKKLVTLAIGS